MVSGQTAGDPFAAAEQDTRAMVGGGWWPATPPWQRRDLIADRVLSLPSDGTCWLFGAWARWYRWLPRDGRWQPCPPPLHPYTRASARPLPKGTTVPPIPQQIVPAGPDFDHRAPATGAFVGADLRQELTSRVRAAVESAAALPVADHPHRSGLFSAAVPATVAVTWDVMLWCAAAPVFDARLDPQLLGLWSPYRSVPLPSTGDPRWLTPPTLETMLGPYAERLRAGRVDCAGATLRTMWAMAGALREDDRFRARADALLAVMDASLRSPAADYAALPHGDRAVVRQWLTRCPPPLEPVLRADASAGDRFREAYHDLAVAVAPLAGDPAEAGFVEPRHIAAALLAADLGTVRRDLARPVIVWLDAEIRELVPAILDRPEHPLRRLWPEDDRLPRPLGERLQRAEPAARDTLFAAMYAADLAWCRLAGGIPARPRGFPAPLSMLGTIRERTASVAGLPTLVPEAPPPARTAEPAASRETPGESAGARSSTGEDADEPWDQEESPVTMAWAPGGESSVPERASGGEDAFPEESPHTMAWAPGGESSVPERASGGEDAFPEESPHTAAWAPGREPPERASGGEDAPTEESPHTAAWAPGREPPERASGGEDAPTEESPHTMAQVPGKEPSAAPGGEASPPEGAPEPREQAEKEEAPAFDGEKTSPADADGRPSVTVEWVPVDAEVMQDPRAISTTSGVTSVDRVDGTRVDGPAPSERPHRGPTGTIAESPRRDGTREMSEQMVGEVLAAAERQAPGDMDGFLRRLDDMVGLAEVKHTVRGLVAEARLAAARTAQGLPSGNPSRHLIFLGDPGTGKATVAGLIGGVYAALGLLDSGHLVACNADGLAGDPEAFAAHAGRAEGGLLLINDAHLLDDAPDGFAELLNLMRDRRDKFMLVCAGPPDEMNAFLVANPGFRAEFGAIIEFRPPTDRELVGLFSRFAERDLYVLDEELRVQLLHRFRAMRGSAGFAYATTARRLFERMVARQAARLAGDRPDTAKAARLSVRDLPDA